MKPKFKTIQAALIVDRPNDQIIKIFNNKFAIVKSAFDNGKFSEPQICFLNNGIIYFFPAELKELKKYIEYIFRLYWNGMDKKYRQSITQAYQLI